MLAVENLTDPRRLLSPPLAALLHRAIRSTPFPGGTVPPLPELVADVTEFITSDEHFFVLGSEYHKPLALALGFFHTSPLFPHPTLVAAYNEGSIPLRNLLRRKVMDILTARGYTTALAINGTGRPDAAWIRGLAPTGMTGEAFGTAIFLHKA